MSDDAPASYRVGLTRDGVSPEGESVHGELHLERLAEGGLCWTVLPPADSSEFPEALTEVDAVVSFGSDPFGEEELSRAPRLRHIARFGSGYDSIDVEACTRRGVLLTNTPAGVRRPVALAALTMLLAVSHRLLGKDRITREGRWEERGDHRGLGLEGQTLGIFGYGGIGAELTALVQPLGLRVLGSNRSGRSAAAEEYGVPLVSLEELAESSDYLVLTAPLTSETRHAVDAALLKRMKPSAHLINIGRGGLVDQSALYDALVGGEIAGAALDVFDPEPVDPAEPLLRLDNVLVSPHSLCWTKDFTDAVSSSAFQAVHDVYHGRTPQHLVNPEAWRD